MFPPSSQTRGHLGKTVLNGRLPNNGFSINSENQGIFTLGSGKQISVHAYMDLVSQFMSAYTGAGGTSGVPTFSLSRTYPNLNICC